MNRKMTNELVISALLLALGLLMPMLFHAVGLGGPIFLPMHIPVFIGGYLLSRRMSVVLGFITPLVSSLLTGMPILFPIGVIMMFELASYGLSVSILSKKTNLVFSLVGSMIIGRIVAFLTVSCLVMLFGLKLPPLQYITGAVMTGLPGIIIQLVTIPALINALKRNTQLVTNVK